MFFIFFLSLSIFLKRLVPASFFPSLAAYLLGEVSLRLTNHLKVLVIITTAALTFRMS